MIKDKIKLINSKDEVERYLKVNGISGKAKDSLVAEWEAFKNNETTAEEPEVVVNEVKTSVVDDESVEVKEE